MTFSPRDEEPSPSNSGGWASAALSFLATVAFFLAACSTFGFARADPDSVSPAASRLRSLTTYLTARPKASTGS